MLWARASLKLRLWLLVLLIPGAMPYLAKVNPWLSACDLMREPPPPHDCPATNPLKPPPPSCGSEAHNKTTHQCLHYFTPPDVDKVCSLSSMWQRQVLATMNLQHCNEFRVLDVLSPALMESMKNSTVCEDVLAKLLDVDATAARITCEFADVLSRFDCQQRYTANFTCNDCKASTTQSLPRDITYAN